MSRTYNLSYIVDKDGNNRIDLISFSHLEELDDFIMSNFVTTDDVRAKYKEVIDIFNQKNKAIFDNAKNSGYRGSIVVTYQDGNTLRRIPVMYKDGKKMKDVHECFQLFNELYNNKYIIREIKTRKSSVFSGDELSRLKKAKYYLEYTQWGSDDVDNFNDFAEMFYKRVVGAKKEKVIEEDLDWEDLYYHFRYMMDYFPFTIGENKEHVRVTYVDVDKLSKIERDKIYHSLYHEGKEIIKYSEIKTPDREGVEVVDSAPDEFKYVFYKALDTGDFDTLYNMYSLEEIEKYTKGKRK
jgi:hypothetical protein